MAEDWARRAWGESEEANLKAAKRAAKMLAADQEGLIEDGRQPDGSAQKPNSPKYRDRKIRHGDGHQPLWRTGEFKNSRNWKARASKKKGQVTLKPPKEYDGLMRIFSAAGLKTVVDEIPADHDEKLQEIVDEEQRKVRPA